MPRKHNANAALCSRPAAPPASHAPSQAGAAALSVAAEVGVTSETPLSADEVAARQLNSQLQALGRGPSWRSGLALFDAAMAAGAGTVNAHTATSALSVAARRGDVAYAERLFAAFPVLGLQPSAHTYTALVRARGGDWRAALGTLEEMRAAGLPPNAHALSAALAACSRGGAAGAAAAVPLFAELGGGEGGASGRVAVDAHLASAFLTLFGRLKDGDGAAAVWALAMGSGVEVDAHLHSAYLTALLRCGRAETAAQAFQDIPTPPSPHCYAAGMRALGAAGASPLAVRAVYDSMEQRQVPQTPHCVAALMAVLAHAGDAAGALHLLRESRLLQEGPPCVCTHLAMAACARAGRLDDALRLLRRLVEAQAADVVSYSTAVLAAAFAARPDEAERLYAAMRDARIQPNDYTFTALIAAHGAAARATAGGREAAAYLRRARAVRDRMRQQGVSPSVHTFNAWIAAAEAARDDECALHEFRAMQHAGVAPNAHTRQLMAVVTRRGTEQIETQQGQLTAISAVAAALAAALIQRGWM